MGRYVDVNTFSPNDSNTIDDVTGFKRKRSEMKLRWEGFLTDEGWHPRQPQDFPIVPVKQQVFPDVRNQAEVDETILTFEVI